MLTYVYITFSLMGPKCRWCPKINQRHPIVLFVHTHVTVDTYFVAKVTNYA